MTLTAPQSRDPSPSDAELDQVSACLFCASSNAIPEYGGVQDLFFRADPGEFAFNRCSDCESLWMPVRPSGERLLKAYSNYYTHGTQGPKGGHRNASVRVRDAYARARFAKSPSALDHGVGALIRTAGIDLTAVDAKYRFTPKAPARVLDYGCGSGAFLMAMLPFGHELRGVEYDPTLLRELSERGIPVDDVTSLAHDSWSDEFDHITLAHVIEHVDDPQGLLARLHKWLKPSGSLYIEVPNANATGLDIFGPSWRGLEAPRHFGLPSQQALIGAIERAGFVLEKQHIETTTRAWMWQESLEASAPEDQPSLQAKMESAPTETTSNAEFLTFLVRKSEIS